jgi:hypothetical protein
MTHAKMADGLNKVWEAQGGNPLSKFDGFSALESLTALVDSVNGVNGVSAVGFNGLNNASLGGLHGTMGVSSLGGHQTVAAGNKSRDSSAYNSDNSVNPSRYCIFHNKRAPAKLG